MDLIENKYIQGLTEILENIGESVEGNLICDLSPRQWTIHRNISKIKNLQYLCNNKKRLLKLE